ncbi:MAG TPA: serine hydrolase domain-containing protein [Flavobacteriaceae bacterium]|nr:serine hydrolase domain-containing protein [Flavobacteriaceae bacterium]
MAKYLGLLLVFVLTGCLNGQVKTAANGIAFSADFLTSAQAELLYEKAKAFPNHTELSLALLENEKIRFVGIKRLNDTLRVTENHQHVFEIGSISKVFTSTLLAEFALDETLRLSDAIQDYVSFPIGTPEKITFQSLANHTSGLPRLPSNLHLLFVDRDNPYKGYDSAKLITYLTEKIALEQAPETKYAYSNLGAGLLGYVLAELRDTTYENLLQEKIFKPYGMYTSSTQMETLNAPIVRGLNPNGEVTSNWDFNVLAGGGAILSTTEDLAKFASAQFDKDNAALLLTQRPTFKVSEYMEVGLGWHILHRKNGRTLLWHNGGTGGYTSSMALDPDAKRGVIILSNVSAFNPDMKQIDPLCFALIDTLAEN